MRIIFFIICLVAGICWIVFDRSKDTEGSKKKVANVFRIIFMIACFILAIYSFSMAASFL